MSTKVKIGQGQIHQSEIVETLKTLVEMARDGSVEGVIAQKGVLHSMIEEYAAHHIRAIYQSRKERR